MANLATSFLGIRSPNPFWLASAPPTDKAHNINRAFEAGWGGAVWKTLGEAGPPIVNVSGPRYSALYSNERRVIGFNNIELITDRPLEVNLREIKQVKRDYPEVPVVIISGHGNIEIAVAMVKDAVDTLKAKGLECDIVGGGGTGSYYFEGNSGVYNELQCGSYAFMDADYGRILDKDGNRIDHGEWENALFILTSVMSHAKADKAIAIIDGPAGNLAEVITGRDYGDDAARSAGGAGRKRMAVPPPGARRRGSFVADVTRFSSITMAYGLVSQSASSPSR